MTAAIRFGNGAARQPRIAAAWADATPGPAGELRVSVVVPTCGRIPLLMRCLHALLQQSIGWQAFEILVVDDAHDKATRHAVQALARTLPPHVLHYLRPAGTPRGGPGAARNRGWRAARAPLVAFTDDDTVPDRDWLREGELAMRTTRAVAVAGRVVVPRNAASDDAPTDHELMTRGLETSEFVTANAFVWRRALRAVGGFDERYRRPWREDSDLQFRLQREGPVQRAEGAVVVHPVRPERWGVSLRQQKNVFYDALLYREHPKTYRERIRRVPPWDYYAIVASTLLAAVLLAAGQPAAAAVAGTLALGGCLGLAVRRLQRTSRRPAHVLEMVATSLLIPYLSVYWRLRGAWHFRVWFV